MLSLLVLFMCEIPIGITNVLRREERKADWLHEPLEWEWEMIHVGKWGMLCLVIDAGRLLHEMLLLEVCS